MPSIDCEIKHQPHFDCWDRDWHPIELCTLPDDTKEIIDVRVTSSRKEVQEWISSLAATK